MGSGCHIPSRSFRTEATTAGTPSQGVCTVLTAGLVWMLDFVSVTPCAPSPVLQVSPPEQALRESHVMHITHTSRIAEPAGSVLPEATTGMVHSSARHRFAVSTCALLLRAHRASCCTPVRPRVFVSTWRGACFQFYYVHFSNFVAQAFPALYYVATGTTHNLPAQTLVGPLVSAGNTTFTVFTKNLAWIGDAFSLLVAPYYRSDVYAETWRNGKANGAETMERGGGGWGRAFWRGVPLPAP